MKKAERNKAGNKALADAKAAVETARALCDELRTALCQARKDCDDAKVSLAVEKGHHEYTKKRADEARKDLAHQTRLVKALTEALADKYCPIPTNINLNVDYRVAKGENQ